MATTLETKDSAECRAVDPVIETAQVFHHPGPFLLQSLSAAQLSLLKVESLHFDFFAA
jgi:hypothetical protein